jgi:peptidoglycan/xylan/chitin deacetylase (PgdA/CDA1 family)
VKALAGHAATALERVGVLPALEALERDATRIRVLAYHRVDELEADPDLDPGLISATPADFRAQMEALARAYNVISLDDFVAACRGERALPARAVLLTFDDGYRDFATHAWPILSALGLPAVLFVPTGFPDEPGPGFWWDRLHAALLRTSRKRVALPGGGGIDLGEPGALRRAHRLLRTHAKSLPHAEAMTWLEGVIGGLAEVPSLHRVLDWDALRKLAGEGLRVCAHGRSHALCTRLTPEALASELRDSLARIEAELGPAAPPRVMAYPASACDDRVRRAVREAGFELAFGGRRGIDRLPLRDPFDVMRIPVNRYGTALLRAQLRPSLSRLGRLVLEGRDRLRASA